MTSFNDLTDVERVAMDRWGTGGSADSTQCLLAVRAAVREMERRQAMSEDHRILFLEEELTAVRDLAYRGVGSPADALEAIRARANRALEAAR